MNGVEMRKARVDLGYTQEQLGKRLGYSREQVVRMEGGKRRIRWCVSLAIKYLEIEVGNHE